MIAALQQDPVIFKDLTQTNLGLEAIDTLRAVPEDWTPASLSLLALGNPVQLEEIKKQPLLPLPVNLRQNIKIVYEKWYQNPKTPTSIKDAGLIALSLRERLRIKGSWDGFHEEFEGKLESSQTVIACLYGIIPDVQDFIDTLISKKIRDSCSKLAVHAILCNPFPQESQFEIFKSLIAGKELELVLDILNKLMVLRPVLTKALANEVLKDVRFKNERNSGQELSITLNKGVGSIFDQQIVKLTQLLRYTNLQELTEFSGGEPSAISDSIKIVQEINAGLHKKLARTLSQDTDPRQNLDDRLRIWKIAVQNDPNNSHYIVGLSNTLVESGRLKDARAYLETCLTDYDKPFDPLLILAVAKIAYKQGDFGEAKAYAEKTYKQIETSDSFFGEDFVSLAELLIAEELFLEAVDTIEKGLLRFPHYPDLLSLIAYIKHHVGDNEDSLEKSYIALAFHGINSNSEIPFKVNLEISKRIIENLSCLNDWESALNERISLTELMESSATEDYHDIATLAIKAGQPEQVINFCKLAIDMNAQDGTAYYLIGKAELEMDNSGSAINHLKMAVQFQPESSKAWLTLADAYKEKDDKSSFMDTLQEAVHAAPEDSYIQFALGKAYLEDNLPSRALEFFYQAIKYMPGELISKNSDQNENPLLKEENFLENPSLSYDISYFLGQTLSALGYRDDARSVFNHAYEFALNSKQLSSQNSFESGHEMKDRIFQISQCYARILLEFEEFDEVIQVLEFADQYGNLDAQDNLDLTRALLIAQPSQENADKAVGLLEKTFHLSQEKKSNDKVNQEEINQILLTEAQALYAEALALSGDVEKAKQAFRDALETPLAENSTWKVRLSIGLGRVALLINEPEMAIASLQEAEKIQKSDSNLYQLLADAYLKTGLLPEAYSTAMKAVELKSSDSQVLEWFSGLVVRIVNQKEAYDPKMISECVPIIERAVLDNPNQLNLFLRLIQLELARGDLKKAFETIDAFSISGHNESKFDIELVLDIATVLRKVEMGEYAIKLLQITIDHFLSLESSQNIYTEELVSNLYFELSICYMEQGDMGNVIQSLNQAVTFDPENVYLYQKSITILLGLSDFESANSFVQEGLNKFPEDLTLLGYAAELFFLSGEFQKALACCDSALNLPAGEETIKQKNKISIIAAEIARSILLTEKASKYLNIFQPEMEDAGLEFLVVCIRAELSLAAKNIEEAYEFIEKAEGIQPDHPLNRILNARLKACTDLEGGRKLLEMGSKEIQNYKFVGEEVLPGDKILLRLLVWRSLGTAWMELNNWGKAIEQLKLVTREYQHDPLSHFLLAKSIAGRAETQRLSGYLDIVTNAPGVPTLDLDANTKFESVISRLEKFNKGITDAQETEEISIGLDEFNHQVLLLKGRGVLAFAPSLDELDRYGELLFESSYTDEDLFVYLLALLEFVDRWSVQSRDHLFQELKAKFGEEINNPKILFVLGLLYSEEDPLTALDNLLHSEKLYKNGTDVLPVRLPMVKYMIAKLALKVREFPAAIEAIHAALALWSDEPAWCEFASDLFQVDGIGNGFPDLSKAAVLLERAVELDANNISYYKKLGDIYSRLGEHSSAEDILIQALDKEPEDGEIWVALAEVQLHSGNLDSAASSAAKAIENSVDGLKPLLLRGEIDIQKNNPKGAYEIAQELLEQFPNHEQALLMLSRALVLLGRSPEAMDLLQTAVNNVKEPLMIQLEYIRLLANIRGFDPALRKLKELYRTNPDHPKVMSAVAELLIRAGKDGQAVEFAKKALKSEKDELLLTDKAQLHFIVGHYYRQEGQLDQAVHYLKASEHLDPKNIETLLELGQVYHERRQYEEAMNLYRKSIELAPDNCYPYYLAGLLLKDQKDYSQAEIMLRKASKLEPDNTQVNRLLSAVTAMDLVHSQKLTASHFSTPTQ
jgi:tetratricopeptide (TPR) repeat protein